MKLKTGTWARIASVLAFWMIAASLAVSQTAAPTQPTKNAGRPDAAAPTADQIVDNYIEASGGRAAWEKLSPRVSKGTISVAAANVSGPVEIDEKAPNKLLVSVTISGSVFLQGFDGKVGWSQDPQNGLREQKGAELTEVSREADFYHPLDLKKLYATIQVVGTEKVGERTAYVIEGAPPEGGSPDRIYFDAQTGLPIRVITQHHNFDGSVEDFQEDFDDYRTVDGVKIPFTVEQSDSQLAFSIKFEEVRHNVELKDSEFAKPAAQ